MAQIFAESLLAGIYAGDPEQLSIQATFPMLVALEREHGSLIRGAIDQRRKRPRTTAPASAFLSLRDGMGSLPIAIAAKLAPDSLRLGTRVTALARDAARWRIECDNGWQESADDVVLAIPPNAAARLLDAHEPAVATTLATILQLSTATGFMAWPRSAIPHPLDASGFIVPGNESLGINASTWVTSKWPDRAPAGHVLLRVFFGGARHPEHADLDDEALLAIGRRELRTTLGITERPVFGKVFRYRASNPQPTVGHVDRMADVHARCAALGGVWVTGGGYDGVGIPDCAKQGEATANQIIQRMKGAVP
jgi:oxygen-dependent protoporphyrinogen oxidase